MIRFATVLFLAWAGQVHAETDATQAAEAAVEALVRAADSLAAAEDAGDRVRALTQTVQAYEDGLAAVREGIRQAALGERVLASELQSRETELSNLLGVLLTLQTSPETATLLHPSGPADTARAGMILADVAPAIAVRVDSLRTRIEELRVVRELQEGAQAQLQTALSGVRDARTALSQAIAARTAGTLSSATDVATMQALVNGADTLQGFAASLASPEAVPGTGTDFASWLGRLPLPADGTLITGYGETDAAGRTRPGIVFATEPGALVTAPLPGTLRYAGPLLDQGQVAILEPEAGVLMIFAGLGQAFGRPGDVIAEGDPLGLMGGSMPPVDQILIETREGSGHFRAETLYIELRQDDTPLNPEEWFAAMAG